MKTIAMLGTGGMGSRIAQNLLNANYPVVVYNRTAEKTKPLVAQGAIFAATPRQAAEQADIVMSMVTDDQISRTIWLDPETGAAAGLNSAAVAIESSSLTVNWTRALATEIEQHGAAFLDAPVVGSRPQAEAGKLIYLVGGKAEIWAQVEAILASTSAASHHIGATGQGMAMKLAVNALFGIQVAALAEMLGMLTKSGITPDQAMACLNQLPVTSPAAKLAGNLMLTANHAPLFPLELAEKDFRYFIQTGQAVHATTPVSDAVRAVYQMAITEGYGQENITGIIQLFA